MTGAPLTCQEMVELITEYLEGAMAATERARFELHLADCAGCSGHLEQLRRTIALTGALRETAIDPQLLDRLLTAFRDWRAADRV